MAKQRDAKIVRQQLPQSLWDVMIVSTFFSFP